MSLRDAWEAEARNWVAWARTPGHDSYWQFHRDRFLELLPPPAGLTLDLGCGEGRFPRDLKVRGYEVISVDASPTLIDYAREEDPDGDYRLADAASLPIDGASVQLVTALLSLQRGRRQGGGRRAGHPARRGPAPVRRLGASA